MSVANGTRPGTKPGAVVANADYVKGAGPAWEALQNDHREYVRYENAVKAAAENARKAALALDVAHCLLHGGHVDRGTMARAGVNAKMSPGQILAHAQSLLPNDIATTALKT